MIAWLIAAGVAAPSVSSAMHSGIPAAHYVSRYAPSERAEAAQRVLHLSAKLGPPIALTPNQPYVDGVRLEIWKPSFVLGTADGGEAGINFWGQHNQGHINVGFTPDKAAGRLLDCRVLTAGPVHYKLYNGEDKPAAESDIALADNHLLLQIPATPIGRAVLVELWPQPETAVMGFFGCDLSDIR